MVPAASISSPRLTGLYEALPYYPGYFRRHAANADETEFRLEVGRQLQDLGQRMVDGAESRPHLLSPEQHDVIEALAEDIGTVLRLLNRTGTIRFVDEPEIAIPQLRETDSQLIILLERLWDLIEVLFVDDTSVFALVADEMATCLAMFLELAEERNRLLGLGWESEFGRIQLRIHDPDGGDA